MTRIRAAASALCGLRPGRHRDRDGGTTRQVVTADGHSPPRPCARSAQDGVAPDTAGVRPSWRRPQS